ncbi:MAG: DNA gyrase inhibitor YacG [Gammaproteobacteria bacterium]|nr:DNA gyrase inhibitor YacG [Gammaproteobacteria bacterium]MDE2345473.1 DNA gyrase inhibitor YacG [Gammaproteobacteria bacterium]
MVTAPETHESVKCPHCGALVPWTAESKFKPFCSERCRLIDLGDWLLEKHAIPDQPPPESQDESGS